MLEISLAFFVFHVLVYDKDLDPVITLNKRFKTTVCKIFPRFIVCRRLRTEGRCRKLLRLCWPLNEVRPFLTSESIYIIFLSLLPDYRDIPHLTSHIT